MIHFLFFFFGRADIDAGWCLWDNGHVRAKFTSNIKITSRTPCRWFMSTARSRTEKGSFSLSLFFSLPSGHLQRGKQPWKAINLACVSRRDASARTARMLSRVFAKRSKGHRQRGGTVEVALGETLFIVGRMSATTSLDSLRWWWYVVDGHGQFLMSYNKSRQF